MVLTTADEKFRRTSFREQGFSGMTEGPGGGISARRVSHEKRCSKGCDMKFHRSVVLLVFLSGAAFGQSEFRRGDANGDGRVVPIQDGYWIIQSLFSAAAPPPCYDAIDVNDDGMSNLLDVIELFNFGYLQTGFPVPAPGVTECGPDPTVDLLSCATYGSCPGGAPLTTDPDFAYRLPTIEGEAGQSVTIAIEFDNATVEELVGFSVGVCHDPGVVSLSGVTLGSAVSVEPDYSEVRVEPDGFVAGVLMSFFYHSALEPGFDLEIFELSYDLVAPGVASLDFCDDLGEGTLANYVFHGFDIAVPVSTSGSVTVAAPTLFRRGDANGDTIFDLADPIFGIMHLFAGGAPPLCRDAGDSNDDGILDLSDGIHMLSALFDGVSPLTPSPGPLTCGVDPTADSLDCASPPDCGG